MNIVLDMDQTLIDGWPEPSNVNVNVIRRPNLDIFLEWCFEHFERVSIWTAASRDWFNKVNEFVFEDILKSINQKKGREYKFDFVFTSEMCNVVWKFSEFHGCSVKCIQKRIRKLHNRKSEPFKHYNLDNTIIIDDTSQTFSANYGNGIQISPFETYKYFDENIWKSDVELLRMALYLKNVVLPHYNKHGTIRNLEKRYWENYIRDLEKTRRKV